ncbi:MAG: glycosyltransferase family 2 protein [Deltaproteobacteria bacterium]|jgi:glycosyltransferase involved in cell wall biosynthesis|nr:glycosyltransferase family 2 protein [Deltaproteobacteria bacterium]
MARVDVIIPVYNSAGTVAESVESALGQTFTDFDVIAVDDGSTDTSAEVLSRYGAGITVLAQPNRGLSAARNAGVRLGSAEYLAFLDADDIWEPEMLEHTVAALDRSPHSVLAYTNVTVVDSAGRPLNAALVSNSLGRAPQLEDLFVSLWPIMPSAVVMRRGVFDAVGGFSEAFRGLGYEDVFMWMRARELGEFVYLPESLVRWRFSAFPHPLKRVRKERDSAKVFEGLVRERWHRSAARLIKARERAPRSILGYIGLRALAEGNRTTARNAFALAIRFDPWRLRNYMRYLRTFLPVTAARVLSGGSRAARG